MGVSVTVRFDEYRDVLADGVRVGHTNEMFTIKAGKYVFELEGPADYVPTRLTVNLSYTSQTSPEEITFMRS